MILGELRGFNVQSAVAIVRSANYFIFITISYVTELYPPGNISFCIDKFCRCAPPRIRANLAVDICIVTEDSGFTSFKLFLIIDTLQQVYFLIAFLQYSLNVCVRCEKKDFVASCQPSLVEPWTSGKLRWMVKVQYFIVLRNMLNVIP